MTGATRRLEDLAQGGPDMLGGGNGTMFHSGSHESAACEGTDAEEQTAGTLKVGRQVGSRLHTFPARPGLKTRL